MPPGPRALRRAVVAVSTVALVLGGAVRASEPPPPTGWLTFGGGAGRLDSAASGVAPSSIRAAWFAPVEGLPTTQPLVARDVPAAGSTTIYAASSTGEVFAYAPNGYLRWRVDLGRYASDCPQLDEYGVTGTPVIDPSSRALYVADAFGRLHALDLATGSEHPGWPVVLYDDYDRELVWGALTMVSGSVYVGTGAYCDRPMQGKLIRVDVATRAVSAWTAVPASLGGGGGIWGWGGVAYSRARDSLFVVTGNAFEGGSNSGDAFSESAGYGEQLVELSRDLDVRAASHPEGITGREDLDFVGSPVVFERAGCGELVAAANKNGHVYLWRSDDIASGPIADEALVSADSTHPLLTQVAYSARQQSLYVVTQTQLVRLAVDADCSLRRAWTRMIGEPELHGSPTIAGNDVWTTVSSVPAQLVAYDAETGMLHVRRELGRQAVSAVTVVGGRIFVDARHAFAGSGAAASTPVDDAVNVAEHTSWADGRHGWQSRETGLYATDDAGATWRRLRDSSPLRVVRTSRDAGVISVGTPTPCNCTTTRLWTKNGGRTWAKTRLVADGFAGRGGFLFSWNAGALNRIAPWPPKGPRLRTRPVAKVPGRIVDVVVVPGGALALATSGVGPRAAAPRIVVVRGGTTHVVALPAGNSTAEAETMLVDWPRIRVIGDDVRRTAAPERDRVLWRSNDGGSTWNAVMN